MNLNTSPRWALTFVASAPDSEVELTTLPSEHLVVLAESMISAMKLCKAHIFEKLGYGARFRILLVEPLDAKPDPKTAATKALDAA